MSTNQVQNGVCVDITAGSAITGGDPVLTGDALFGVAVADIANGAVGTICTEGVYDLPKQSSLAISAGAPVFYDSAAEECDTTQSNLPIGICTEAAASSDTTVRVKLFGYGFAAGASDDFVNVVAAFPDATGGGTTSAGTIQVNDLDGNAVKRAVVIRVDLSDTQYAGPGDAAANATMATATTGSILAGSGSASLVIKTDATGAFAATITNAADETVYVSARTADGGVDALTAGCVVRGCVPDDVTWSA